MTYVDSSVLAAYYCPEPLSGRAQKALEQEPERAISWLVEVELASAISRKVRARELRRPDALRILAAFQSHLGRGIYIRLGMEMAHFAQAREWLGSFATPLRTLDALHAAMAAVHGYTLLTADAGLANACSRIGVAARLIR